MALEKIKKSLFFFWKPQRRPADGCLQTFYRNLVQLWENDCLPQCSGTRYSDICCGSMSVSLSVCLCFGFGTGQFGAQLPNTLIETWGLQTVLWNWIWILFHKLVDGVEKSAFLCLPRSLKNHCLTKIEHSRNKIRRNVDRYTHLIRPTPTCFLVCKGMN